MNPEVDPYPDQWVFLSSLDWLPVETVETLVGEASRPQIISVRPILTDEQLEEDPWPDFASVRRRQNPVRTLAETIRLVIKDLVSIEKGFSPVPPERLNPLAAFQNPEFYRTQAMRLPTFNLPRIIRCAEDFPKHIGLPGMSGGSPPFLKDGGTAVTIDDQRNELSPIGVHFRGELRPNRKR